MSMPDRHIPHGSCVPQLFASRLSVLDFPSSFDGNGVCFLENLCTAIYGVPDLESSSSSDRRLDDSMDERIFL